MSKKPKPRSLNAEPLEERLPVSSSAAGVLFGFGLAQNEPGVERSATPGYEASQVFRTESLAQQSSPIDLTLDLQLDPLAVDLVHSEESLLDATSSPSDDPFVLTPLTPDIALSDTETDAHRELGDELLQFQISTLDFTEVSFEPMTLHHGFARNDFGDALTPPEDLTAYGYSPIANELQDNDDEGGSRCGGGGGCGCGCTTYVSSACLWGGVGCGTSGASVGRDLYTGTYNYYPADGTMYVFQDGNTVSVSTGMSWVAPTGTGTITITPGKNEAGWMYTGDPNWAGYWNMTTVTSGTFCTAGAFSTTFVWTRPDNVASKDAPRDFMFTYTVSGGNSVSLFVHICYAEIKTVDFDDHGVLRSNWENDGNGFWIWDYTYTFTGTPKSEIGPNWDANRKDTFGKYITVGASYTKGSKAKVDAVLDMDFGGKNWSYQIKGSGTSMEFLSGTLTGATSSAITMTSSVSLPGSINKTTTDLTWKIVINGASFGAGKSGSHTIYTTLDTPIQSYVTPPLPDIEPSGDKTRDNTTTEKRLEWAVDQTQGATTRTGGTVENPTTGAVEKMVAANGHGPYDGKDPLTAYEWWHYLDTIEPNELGDCATMAALAIGGLGQVGVPATHNRAWPDKTPITVNSCDEMRKATLPLSNGQTINLRLIYEANNFEAFLTVEDAGITKAYTLFPPRGPIVASSTESLYYKVLYEIGVRHVFWALNGTQTINGLPYADMTPVKNILGPTGWDGCEGYDYK